MTQSAPITCRKLETTTVPSTEQRAIAACSFPRQAARHGTYSPIPRSGMHSRCNRHERHWLFADAIAFVVAPAQQESLLSARATQTVQDLAETASDLAEGT